jgi:hypothetical protein
MQGSKNSLTIFFFVLVQCDPVTPLSCGIWQVAAQIVFNILQAAVVL